MIATVRPTSDNSDRIGRLIKLRTANFNISRSGCLTVLLRSVVLRSIPGSPSYHPTRRFNKPRTRRSVRGLETAATTLPTMMHRATRSGFFHA